MDAVILSLVGLVSLFNLALGFIILLSDARKLNSYLFFGLCVSVSLWTAGIGVFIASTDAGVAYFAARSYYAAAATIGYMMLAFSIVYINPKWARVTLLLLAVPLIAVIAFSIDPHGLVKEVHILSSGNVAILDKQIYSYYAYFFLTYMYVAIAWIGIKLFINPVTGDKRKQLPYIFVALLLAGTFGVFFNLILPFFDNYSLIWMGPLFSIIMVGLVFTAIVRHNLFNVTQAIARTVAYAMLLVSLAVIYSALVFTSAQLFFDSKQVSPGQSFVNTIFAVILAFTYQPLKRFFDRVTNKIFFRASYDLQDAIDALGEIIVAKHKMSTLVGDSYKLIDSSLHPQILEEFAISTSGEIVHAKRSHATGIDVTLVSRLMGDRDIVFIDHTEDQNDDLSKYLRQHKLSVAVRLSTASRIVGFILLGPKISGSYNSTDERLLTVTRDELAVAFENTMRLEEIEEFNATLQQNIHDATSKLRASNKKLQHLDESKDEFISMASHQLRTPLTSIKGYISMVLDGDMGEITPQQRKVLEEAFASSQRMVYLIGDFLNVSRIQTGKFMLEKSRVQLANIIKDEIQQLKDTAAARHITLAYTAPTNFPELELDENKIRQVMMNFIDNAIYYSPEDTTITVSIVKHPHDIIFKVDDQGIGVPKEEQHQLFTKFYRASNARKQRPDGTGIGLFMAKKVIVAHGGSIIFETREGKGSTFGFRLPLTAVTAQSEPARTEAIAQQV